MGHRRPQPIEVKEPAHEPIEDHLSVVGGGILRDASTTADHLITGRRKPAMRPGSCR
jgi:hypothetical protein